MTSRYPRRLLLLTLLAMGHMIAFYGVVGASIAAGDAHLSAPAWFPVIIVLLGLPIPLLLAAFTAALWPVAFWPGDAAVLFVVEVFTAFGWARAVLWAIGRVRPNKPLQPTRAAEPNGQPEAARRGPRG